MRNFFRALTLSPTQQRGRAAERLACAELRRRGRRVLATNVRFPVGELDIIARHGAALCFIEVKARASAAFGHPAEMVTREKRRRFLRAVQWYLTRHPWQGEIRFDVVAILQPPGAPPAIDLIPNAFTADDCV